jgi:hypothetical protein
MKRRKSRFFAHHPRTHPTELLLCGAPDTFGAPFAQNDTANYMRGYRQLHEEFQTLEDAEGER